jgi:hypothetical protein
MEKRDMTQRIKKKSVKRERAESVPLKNVYMKIVSDFIIIIETSKWKEEKNANFYLNITYFLFFLFICISSTITNQTTIDINIVRRIGQCRG